MELVKSYPIFAVIGDSAAFGTGDEINPGQFRGWAKILADQFRDGCEYLNFSRPGAKSSEVATTQLEKALSLNPDICAVIAGGNDLLRNGFDPELLYQNLKLTCEKLGEIGSEILMIQLHDPNKLLKLPRLLRRVLTRRVEAVNAVYLRIAAEFDLILVKTRSIPDVHNRENWHIDRMHPGPKGHFILARTFAENLRKRGWNLQVPANISIASKSRRENLLWYLKNATPWFLKRSVDLLPAALILMTLELIRIGYEKLKKAEAITIYEINNFEVEHTTSYSKAS